MLRKLFTVPLSAWVILGVTTLVSVVLLFLRTNDTIAPSLLLYVVEPVMALSVAGLAYGLVRGKPDRIRHKTERAFIVGSVVSVWFVAYFLSGLVVTYVHNAVVASFAGVALNVVAYSVVAVSFEYVRRGALLLAGRRNVLWFGVIVAAVFAVQQMNLAGLHDAHTPEDLIKLFVSDFAPVIVGSILLTYLSFTAGLPSQLTYRLGLIAITILPPIIPKYDWYMIGVSSVLLAIAVYIVMDRTRPDQTEPTSHRRHHPRVAFDVMFSLVMVALVLLMTGVFSYKPVVIMSNSMVPVFSRGSVVIIQRITNPMDIRIGDIIQYEADNRTITHRVVAIDVSEDGDSQPVFTTKGDNNPSQDPPVEAAHVIGIVRSTVPYVGYPTVWLKDASGIH